MTKLDKKLSKAYGKVGKKLGSKFDIYNPISYENDPLDSYNWVSTEIIALSESNFSNSKKEGFSVYDVYSSFDNIKSGSLLVNVESNEIYVITNREENHGINAIPCYSKISISKYSSNYDGTAPVLTNIVKDLPCLLLITGSNTESGIITQSRSGNQFTHTVIIRFQVTEKLDIQINDEITDDNGNRYEIVSFDYTSTGYKVVANGLRN